MICSLLLMWFLTPALILVALTSFQSGKGCLSRVEYAGRSGRSFVAYKILTATRNETGQHRDGPPPRLVRLLSQSGVDELPQLWNVLCGDMSLVGPRPVTHDELHADEKMAVHYSLVKPGFCGLWGRGIDIGASGRFQALRHYALSASLVYDLVVLSKTANSAIGHALAYKRIQER